MPRVLARYPLPVKAPVLNAEVALPRGLGRTAVGAGARRGSGGGEGAYGGRQSCHFVHSEECVLEISSLEIDQGGEGGVKPVGE
jgi:hypothetical protein